MTIKSKIAAFVLSVALIPGAAFAASAIDGTVPKAPYRSTNGTCAVGYKFENGTCNWLATSEEIRNNFAAAKAEIEALQAAKVSNTSPLVISGDCSGTGTLSNTAISCSSLLRRSNNLSDLASVSTARTNLGLGTAATQNITAFLQPLNNLSDVVNAATARANIGANNAANLTTGTVPTARLGTGTANSTTFLSGDQTYKNIVGGTNGQIQVNDNGVLGGLSSIPVDKGGTGNATGDLSALQARAKAGDTLRRLDEHFSNTYDVGNFGAKCEGEELSDVSTTAGSPTITSASNTFTAADIGKVVEINSNNNYEIIATGTIISVSGNSATLNSNALYTGSNTRAVIFRSNDNAGIQAAIDYAAAQGGGYVRLPPRVCSVTGLTLKRQVILEGQGRNASLIYLIASANSEVVKSESFDSLKGTGLNYGPNGTFNGIVSDSRVPSWFGLKNVRLDGNRFRQTVAKACASFYGNAQIIDSAFIHNCSGDGIYTEASGGYSYSQYDWKAQEEGFINDLVVRNVNNNGWVMRGPHDSIVTSYLVYDWGHAGTGYYGMKAETSGTVYSGNAHFWHVHAYTSAGGDYLNFRLAAGGDIQFLYSDFGKTEIVSNNMKINTLYMLQCGVGGATPCLDIQGDFNTISQFNWSWYTLGTLPTGLTVINLPSGSDGNTINNISGSSTVSTTANNTIVKNRGNFNSLAGILSNSSGAGNVCADLGGSYNVFDFRSFNCNTHVLYTAGGFHNKVNGRAYRVGAETALNGTINAADSWTWDGTEVRFENVPFGSATNPGLTFGGTLANGLYGTSTSIATAFGGTPIMTWNASGTTATNGVLTSGVAGTTRGTLRLAGNTSGTVTIAPQAAAGTYTLTLPNNTGTSGQVLSTDGTGATSWVANGSGSTPPGGTNGQLQFNNAGAFGGLTLVPVANGGTGTATPSLVAGANVTVTGTWPNQTISATGGGGGGSPGGTNGQIQFNNAGSFGGVTAVPVANGGTGKISKYGAQSALNVPAYALAGNSHGIPVLTGSTAAWVQNNWKWHVAPAGADFTCIKAKFVNWRVGTNSEQQGSYDFTLRAGLVYKNKPYRFTFNGQTDYSLARTWGSNEVWSDPLCMVNIKGGDGYYITTRTVANDAGAAGTYTVQWNSGGRTSRRDGVIGGTDPTVDYTMGVGVCHGHTYNAATVNGSGNATAGNLNLSGIGCTAGLNIDVYCGAAGCNTPGATSPGTGAGSGGYCTNTNNNGGQVASIFLNGNTGTDYSTSFPPIIGCGGTNTAGTGFGTATSLYTASVVAGIPSKPIPSVLLFGDSNITGFASVDGLGNLNGSHGALQQWLDTTYGTTKVASVGTSCVGYAANRVQQEAYMQDIVNNGVQISHVINEMGSNDFLGSTAGGILATVQSCNQARNTFFKNNLGAYVYQTTISPQITSAGSKVDRSLMVPYNANYNLGGVVTQYNALVNSLSVNNNGAIDTSIVLSDTNPSFANLPRTDAFIPANKSCTTTSGSAVVTIADTSGLFPTATMGIQGTGIPAGATISTVTRNTSVTMSANATASGTVTCSFTTAAMAGDGVHWSVPVGMPYLVRNLPTPNFTFQ